MMQPLQALCTVTSTNAPIGFTAADGTTVTDLKDAETIVLGLVSFPKNTPTELVSTNKDSVPYTLASLVHFYLNGASHGSYVRHAVQSGIPVVFVGDRQKVKDILSKPYDEHAIQTSIKRAAEQVAMAGKRLALDKLPPVELSTMERQFYSDITAREMRARPYYEPILSPKSFANLRNKAKDIFLKQDHKPEKTRHQKQTTVKKRKYIIIVPAAATSLITMFNARQFLQDMVFVSSDGSFEREEEKPHEITFTREMSNHESADYAILDSVEQLRPNDWDRVVCAFVTGAAWQFKGWVWSKPFDIFQHVKGFHLKYSIDHKPDTIMSWNITTIDIHPHKRHMDKAIVLDFWNQVDAFVLSKKK
jgi:parafibromin